MKTQTFEEAKQEFIERFDQDDFDIHKDIDEHLTALLEAYDASKILPVNEGHICKVDESCGQFNPFSEIQFGIWLTGHDGATIKQMYDDFCNSGKDAFKPLTQMPQYNRVKTSADTEMQPGGVCKWRQSISTKVYIVPSCCTWAIIDSDMMKLNYIYCPYCGKLIERI